MANEISDKPLVSIVTPSYNQGQFIEETILSVKNQLYPNIEYIVIDGGSTDRSVEIIKRYSDQLAYWISGPDQGPADACNKGFQRSSGEILAYLNSDDVLLPHAVETAVSIFMSESDIDVVYGDEFIIDERNKVLRKVFSSPFFNPYLYVLGGFVIAQQATFWRRTPFEAVGGFNPRNQTCWDGELWIDMALEGAKFKHVKEFLAGFRRHPASISVSGSRKEYLNDRSRLFRKVFNRSPNILDVYVLGFISRVVGKFLSPQNIFHRWSVSGMNIENEEGSYLIDREVKIKK